MDAITYDEFAASQGDEFSAVLEVLRVEAGTKRRTPAEWLQAVQQIMARPVPREIEGA